MNPQDEITDIPFDEEMGDSWGATPILERETWSNSSSTYSLEAVLNQIHTDNAISPDLDTFTPPPRDVRRYGFSPPADFPLRRRSLWNLPTPPNLRRSIGLPSQDSPVPAVPYEPNPTRQQARHYTLPTAGAIEARTLHHPYYTQEKPTVSRTPPNAPSRYQRRDAPKALYPIMSPHAVPSHNSRQCGDDSSNFLPVRVYAPLPPLPPPVSPQYRQHYSSPPYPCPIFESPSQSRFSMDDNEQKDVIGHFSLIHSRSQGRSNCPACGGGAVGSGEVECTCSFSLRLWVRTKIKKLDKRLKTADGRRYTMRYSKRVSTRADKTDSQDIKEENTRPVPPPPPNTPAHDENIDSKSLGPKRAAKEKDLEGESGRKIKRAKVTGGCLLDGPRMPPAGPGRQEGQAEEPGKWLGKWKKGVRKVIIVSKASGVADKK